MINISDIKKKMESLPNWPWSKKQMLDYIDWSTKAIPVLIEEIESLKPCLNIMKTNEASEFEFYAHNHAEKTFRVVKAKTPQEALKKVREETPEGDWVIDDSASPFADHRRFKKSDFKPLK